MSVLNLFKKTCWDGSNIWFYESCPPVTPVEPPPIIEPPITNPPATNLPDAIETAFTGFNIGQQEFCGQFSGTRPSVAVAPNGEIYMIVDQGTSSALWYFTKISGIWKSGLFAKGTKGGQYDASRLYMPHIEIDKKGRAWVSTKFGCKEYGKMLGQGLWMIENANTFEPKMFRWVKERETHKGNGNVMLDLTDVDNAWMVATQGKMAYFDKFGNLLKLASLGLGDSGEKVRGLISRTSSIKHAVMGGFSGQSSSYTNSNRTGKAIVWADYKTYPEQGNDMAHPGIGIDWVDPNRSYISADYNGIVINVWNGSAFTYPTNSLKVLDSKGNMGAGVDRFGPQWTPKVGGGAFVTWCNGRRIKIAHVKKNGKVPTIMDICDGASPSMCTGEDGTIHLVYNLSGMKYRKLTIK